MSSLASPEMPSFYTPSTSHTSHASVAVDDLLSKCSSMAPSSSSSSSSPSSPSKAGFLRRSTDRVWLEYYRYEVTFGLYVMTPVEKLAANMFVIVVLSMLLWALLLYCPSLLYQKLSRLLWLLTGHSGEEMGIMPPAVSPMS